MKLWILTTLLMFSAAAPAQNLERIAPRTPDKDPNQDVQHLSAPAGQQAQPRQETQVSARLTGIRLMGSLDARLPQPSAEDAGIRVIGLDYLNPAVLQERLQTFLDQPLSLADIDTISQRISDYAAEQDHFLISVLLPEQDISAGVLQLLVLEGRLGEVTVEGNRHFSAEQIRNNFRLESGKPLLSSRLREDLDWVNRNPFRQVEMVLRPGKRFGETDLQLKTRDRRPLRLYGGYENSGNNSTGQDRYFSGINLGNVFGLDHQLNYQFTGGNNFNRYQAHAASYLAPLPWRHILSLSAAHVRSNPGADGVFDRDGKVSQISARYQIPLNRWDELGLGFDFKRSNNNLEFGGQQVFDATTEVNQFLLSLSGERRRAQSRHQLDLRLVWSPGDISGKNGDQEFAATRAGAGADYLYGRLQYRYQQRLPADYSASLRALGQISNGPLLGSEQLIFGGYDSLRGYDESEAGGDAGFIFNAELRSPAFGVARRFGLPQWMDDAQGLLFFDYGKALTHQAALQNRRSSLTLASWGLGLRYTMGTSISLRLDYGFQLHDTRQSPSGDNKRLHLGVSLAF